MDTVVIGIDGGEWDVIDSLIDADELPNLQQLLEEGCRGPLESVTPPVSPPAWTSIQTGTNPGKHGIFDFNMFEPSYERRSVNASDRRACPFWRPLNDHGVSTGLFKVPFTYPPSDVDGFLVSGFPTPNTVDDYATPVSIAEELGSPASLFEDWSLQQDGDYDGFRENLVSVAERQTDVFLDLVGEYDTDFGMTVYDGSDRIQHFFWKHYDESHPRHTDAEAALAEAIPEYYRTLDESIGRILDAAADDCNVLVISDHGFGPLTKDVYIDEVLDEHGYLTRESTANPQNALDRMLSSVVSRAWTTIRRLDFDTTVKRVLPETLLQQGREIKNDENRDIVWEETEAFFTTLSGQAIHLNLEGRFENGTVSAAEYESLLESLKSDLLDLRDPQTGETLVRNVFRSDEVFEGEAVETGPDLIVETHPQYTLKGGRSEDVVAPSTQNAHDRSGDHRTEGILVADGPAFRSESIPDATILDIAPTLLYLMGSPIPDAMDGDVLESLFTERFLDAHQTKRTSEYGKDTTESRRWSDEESEELEERLNNMGYLG